MHACSSMKMKQKKEGKDDACPPFPLSPNLPKSAVSSSYSQQLAWRCKQVRGVTSRHRAAWLGPKHVTYSPRPSDCRLSERHAVPAAAFRCHHCSRAVPSAGRFSLTTSLPPSQRHRRTKNVPYSVSVTPSNTRNLKSSIASITFATSANVRNVLMLETGGTAADKGGA